MRLEPRERKVAKSVNLPPRLWDFVKEVGGGEYATGIRYIIELAYKKEKTTLSPHTGADCSRIDSR